MQNITGKMTLFSIWLPESEPVHKNNKLTKQQHRITLQVNIQPPFALEHHLSSSSPTPRSVHPSLSQHLNGPRQQKAQGELARQQQRHHVVLVGISQQEQEKAHCGGH